jgi:hypothetical protein
MVKSGGPVQQIRPICPPITRRQDQGRSIERRVRRRNRGDRFVPTTAQFIAIK